MEKIKKFQYVFIDEACTKISYDGIENKGSRPYLVIKKKMFKRGFIAVPLTSVKSKITNLNKKQRKEWIKVKLEENDPSYIKLDKQRYFSKKKINKCITPKNLFLKESEKKEAKKILKTIKTKELIN